MDSNNEYTTRAEHGVTHFHHVIIKDGKPVRLMLTEPDKHALSFLKKTNKPKTTIVNNLDYPFL